MDIETAKLILSVCALVVSVLTLCGFGVYMSLHTKKRFEKKEAERAEIERLKEEQYLKRLTTIISGEFDKRLTPIQDDVKLIKANLALNTEGTVTILRNDMKKSLDSAKEKGYASTNYKANWNELYSTYSKLGGNHFQEYVDGWKEEMRNLPLEKKKTRQKLNEAKK